MKAQRQDLFKTRRDLSDTRDTRDTEKAKRLQIKEFSALDVCIILHSVA